MDSPNRRKKFLFGGVVVFILFGLGAGAYLWTHSSKNTAPAEALTVADGGLVNSALIYVA